MVKIGEKESQRREQREAALKRPAPRLQAPIATAQPAPVANAGAKDALDDTPKAPAVPALVAELEAKLAKRILQNREAQARWRAKHKKRKPGIHDEVD
jgi:hypothetical protein